MYAEVSRDEWQRTSAIIAHIVAVNSTDRNKKITPSSFNPWESGQGGNSTTTRIPLTEPGNFQHMRKLAGGSRNS